MNAVVIKTMEYKENDKFGLMDLDGYKLTDAIYQSISSLKNKPGAIKKSFSK